MTLIKSEPNTDSSISLLDGKIAGIQKSKDSADSRPALGSKKVNVVSGKKEPTKDLTKYKFEEFLLNAGGGRQANLSSAEFKTGFSSDRALIKKEPDISKNANPSSYSTPVKRTAAAEESADKEKKKLDTAGKLKKVATQNEERESQTVQKPLKTPGPYRPITEMLYESSSKSLNESEAPLFQDLDQESERKFCREAGQWSLDEWISQGQMLLNAHTSLVGQLVRERIELSGKFRAITSVINDRAEALNRQGQLLDEKLRKIENLGKEILDII
ncbi:hypothetical protein HG536_0A05820 [Torulaspora globosa]|uniref:Extracellular mutant protein 11 C-terminal domain-containing protein n=1 Tax=Torulaspora globosa TaxID=48254 RepID=A0A7G3ZB81_9SACH|nr:uncharacterized protein HG536_0A05820 [Torulaspora globosa]QLL30767.1 hypothetical protein HG536_0A05820 [Torulaspora globosa]